MNSLTPLESALRTWLKAMVEKHGAKQLWLSSATKICPGLINGMLTGRKPVSLQSLEKLAPVFETTVSAILAEAEALIP